LHSGGHFSADAAETQHRQSFSVQLRAREIFPLPGAFFQRGARWRDVPLKVWKLISFPIISTLEKTAALKKLPFHQRFKTLSVYLILRW